MENTILQTLILLVLSFVLINFYFRIADKYNIIDKPNHRSSHSQVTIRGGGIIIPIMILNYELVTGFPYPYFFTGLILLSIISFLDDVFTLPSRYRLFIQLTAVLLLLIQVDINNVLFFIAALIVVTGFINGYNFMDGINGITGIYSLVLMVSIYFVNLHAGFISEQFFIYTIIPLLVFLFYNFRKKAKCFAGDVGSVSLAYIFSFLLLLMIIKTGNVFYLFFVVVYGIDVTFTIIQRLKLGQNIFEAHRMHLYQLMANEAGMSHRKVSLLYGLVQLIINLFVIAIINSDISISARYVLFAAMALLLVAVYIFFKMILMNKYLNSF